MTEPILSPAEEADADRLLDGLRERPEQYAGLTVIEAAAARTSAHMSTCDRPSRLDCRDCSDELHAIRRYIVAVRPGLEAEGLRWAADRIDPALDGDPGLVEDADRGTATMLRHWAYLRDPAVPEDGTPALCGEVGTSFDAEYNPHYTEPCALPWDHEEMHDWAQREAAGAPSPAQLAARHAVPEDGTGDDGAPVAAPEVER